MKLIAIILLSILTSCAGSKPSAFSEYCQRNKQIETLKTMLKASSLKTVMDLNYKTSDFHSYGIKKSITYTGKKGISQLFIKAINAEPNLGMLLTHKVGKCGLRFQFQWHNLDVIVYQHFSKFYLDEECIAVLNMDSKEIMAFIWKELHYTPSFENDADELDIF